MQAPDIELPRTPARPSTVERNNLHTARVHVTSNRAQKILAHSSVSLIECTKQQKEINYPKLSSTTPASPFLLFFFLLLEASCHLSRLAISIRTTAPSPPAESLLSSATPYRSSAPPSSVFSPPPIEQRRGSVAREIATPSPPPTPPTLPLPLRQRPSSLRRRRLDDAASPLSSLRGELTSSPADAPFLPPPHPSAHRCRGARRPRG